MKKILFFMMLMICATACSPHMYSTRSSGQDNASFIVVLRSDTKYENVSVIIDGKSFPIDKIYKVKLARKTHPIITTPGKHHIKVISGETTLIDEKVFLGLQETKKIILK